MSISAEHVQEARSDRRRHRIVVSMGLLALLGMGPIVGHHVAGGLERMLADADHFLALCLIALRAMLDPVHHLFHILLAAGLCYAAWDRVRAHLLLRRTIDALEWKHPRPGSAVHGAASAVGLDPARILVAADLPVAAFTAGWVRPRIYVALEIADRLSPGELAAVLAHEGAHAARRDPLCLSTLRFLANALFWLPVLRRLARDCVEEVEFRADDLACRGRPYELASAIIAAAEWGPALRHQPGVGIHNPDLLSRRIRRLTGEQIPSRSNVTRSSIVGAAFALALVWGTGVVMAQESHAPRTNPLHCEHQHAPPWSHLFCAREAASQAAPVCPHEHT